MQYKDWIKSLEAEFVGKRIKYDGNTYTVAKVDYNGIIHINKQSEHNETTAVYLPHEARKALV